MLITKRIWGNTFILVGFTLNKKLEILVQRFVSIHGTISLKGSGKAVKDATRS
jgi:hypothetical protein